MLSAQTAPFKEGPRHKTNLRTSEELIVSSRPLTQPNPDPRYPRLHTDKQLRQIAASIEAFGFTVPIQVNTGKSVAKLEAEVVNVVV
jgi:hypothetical protein